MAAAGGPPEAAAGATRRSSAPPPRLPSLCVLRCGVLVRRPPRVGVSKVVRLARRGRPVRARKGVRPPVRDGGCWADAGGVPRGHPERRPETGAVDALGPHAAFLPRGLRGGDQASRHAAGAATSGQSRREVRARATLAQPTAPPCSVRCVCPPPAAPGHGRTWRHRAGILRLRAHAGRGRPAPEASGGPRRGPRGRVHLPLKDLGRAPETVVSGVLTAGTPPGPERGVGGRTGLSPRRRSCSGVHLRGPALRGAGDGGETRRPPSAPCPGGDAPRAWLAPGVSAASCPLPRDAAVSGRPERVQGARSPSCRRHARVVQPAPRPSRGEDMDA